MHLRSNSINTCEGQHEYGSVSLFFTSLAFRYHSFSLHPFYYIWIFQCLLFYWDFFFLFFFLQLLYKRRRLRNLFFECHFFFELFRCFSDFIENFERPILLCLLWIALSCKSFLSFFSLFYFLNKWQVFVFIFWKKEIFCKIFIFPLGVVIFCHCETTKSLDSLCFFTHFLWRCDLFYNSCLNVMTELFRDSFLVFKILVL